jgi:uncharacterized membrane protein YgdD (TMEM256/DUF423 family)
MTDSKSLSRSLFALGSISAAIGVAAGAFGAHGLSDQLKPEMLAIYETALHYQIYHAFALLATAWAAHAWGSANIGSFRVGGWCFALGTVLFSGSLYILVFTDQRWLGAITPIGGMLFLVGWITLAWTVWKQRKPTT